MADSQTESLYIPEYDMIPSQWSLAQREISERFTNHADAVNVREIGWYLDVETDSGKKFIPVSNQATSETYRTIFRKVIDTGTLPNTSISMTAHGIDFGAEFCLLHLYGGATDPGNDALPLPYVDTTSSDSVQVSMDTTNIIIETAANYSDYTRSYIIVEYIQEV